MVATRWASRGEKGLGVTLGLVVSLGSPAPALAQTPSDAGSSTWSFPDQAAAPEAPLESAPPSSPQEPPATAPPPTTPPPPPAELPPLRPVAPPTPAGPRFPVTVSTGAASVLIRGDGIGTPLTCSGSCAFDLWEGTYWFEIRASGRNWTVPVTVTEPEHVVVEKPNSGARGLGVAGIIVGGSLLSVAGLVSYSVLVTCAPGSPDEGSSQCESGENALPYWLAAAGVGAVMSAVGIALFIGNNEPSVEILPALGNRARREPETFIGLGSVRGSTLPGLSLQTSF
jgi:hypothetical protein